MSLEDKRLNLHGLVLDPSAILAGESAVRQSANFVQKRDGLVETRGGLECFQSDLAIAASVPNTVYVRETGTSKWYVSTDGSTTKVYEASNVSAALTLSGDAGYMRAEPFADRQCWTFPKALRMLDTPETFAGAFTRMPGAPRGPGPRLRLSTTPVAAASSTLLLGYLQAVAYRVVIARRITTSQGVRILFGAPSDRAVIWGGYASDETLRTNVNVTVPTGCLMAGDEIHLYRTDVTSAFTYPLNRTDGPGDEMTLVATHLLTSTPAANSTWTYEDSAGNDTFLGPSLYTNATQEGIEQSNYRIRVSRDVAFYNSMAFYAGGTPGQTFGITCKSMEWNAWDSATTPTDKTGTLNSWVVHGDTSTVTNTTSITNCSPTVTTLVANGATVGMHVNIRANDPLDSTASPAYGTVTLLDTVNNRITLATTNTATTVNTEFVLWDWFGVAYSGGQIDRVFQAPGGAVTSATAWSLTSGVYYTIAAAAGNSYYAVSTVGRVAGGAFDAERAWAFRYTSAVGTTNARTRLYTVANRDIAYAINTELRVEWEDLSNGADARFDEPFEFVSSKPLAFSREVGLTYAANLCRSEREGGLARLWASKVGLPEAVPLGNYIDIGDIAQPIVRVVATTDSLWVFKTDGLWRVYGDSPDDLVVQPFDPLAQMVAPLSSGTYDPNYDCFPWVRRVGNRVVAWTKRGVLVVDSTGAQNIDLPVRSYLRALLPGNATNPAIMQRAFSGVDLTQSLVVFGCQHHTYASNGFAIALHIDSGTWWTLSTTLDAFSSSYSFLRGSGDSDLGRMFLGVQNGFANYYDPPAQYSAALQSGLPFAFSDRLYGPGVTLTTTITSVAADGVTVTLAAAKAMCGCLIKQGSAYYMALPPTLESLTTAVTVDRAGLTAGTVTIEYYPIDKRLTYAITTQGSPQVQKFFVESYLGFQNIRGGTYIEQRWRARAETTESAWFVEQYPGTGKTTLNNAQGLTVDREFQSARDIARAQTRTTGCEVTVRHHQAATYMAIDSAVVSFDPRTTRIKGRS